MTPAEKVKHAFGGAVAFEAETGITQHSLYRWIRPRSEGGCGGLVPQKNWTVILAAAERKGLGLALCDLTPDRGDLERAS